MTDTVEVALIVSAAPTILALSGLVVSLRNGAKADRAVEKIEAVHVQINSRMDELLASTAKSSLAQGKAEGIESERIRQ